MRRLLFLAFVAVAVLVFAGRAPAGTAAESRPTIYVTNAADLPPGELVDALPAFQAALDEDFGPAWNATAQLELVGAAPAGGWTIAIESHSDVPGAAGYHTVCAGDVPCAKVFVDEGFPWQLVFTHELFEMLADPRIDRATYVWRKSVFYALEVADPVQDPRWAYSRPGASGAPVMISDFVTERWFDAHGGGLLDFGGHCRYALRVLAGGWMSVNRDGFWSEIEFVHGRRASIFKARWTGLGGRVRATARRPPRTTFPRRT